LICAGEERLPGRLQVGGQISEAQKDNIMLQNELAWRIATDKNLEQRDLALAEPSPARQRCRQRQEPGVLDTLARVLFMEGKRTRRFAPR